MKAEDVLAENLGSSAFSALEDIQEYLISVVEESSVDVQEAVETLASMLEGAVEDTEVISKKIIDQYNQANGISTEKKSTNQNQLLDAPITVGLGQTSNNREFVKQTDQISLVDKERLAKAEKKKKQRQEKKARREELKYVQKMAKEGISVGGYKRSEPDASGSRDIKLSNFSIAYGRSQLLVDANLSIIEGRKYGLVGRNGSGKSTLLRHISQRELQVQANISILHVEQEVEGDDTTVLRSVVEADLELVELWEEEKTLMQKDPENMRLPVIYKRLAEIESDTAESRAASILAGLSFSESMLSQPTKEFSGGWRMRIALARALFCHPDLLLLDEPTNHLDFHAIVWLERFLETWEGTLVIVSHQREFLNKVCTDIAHLHNQTITQYRGNYDTFEKAANEFLRQQKKAFEAQQMQKKHIQSFIDRFRANAKRASMVQSRIKKLQKMADVSCMVEDGAVELPFLSPAPVSPPILQFEDCAFRYGPGDELLFTDVNLGIDLESRVALVGKNGSGKSTLLKLLTGELQPSSGSVYRNSALKFATFSQHFVDQLDLNLSPLEYFLSIYPTLVSQEVRSHLGKYGIIGDTALRSIRTLSGGQKSRVVFAKIAYERPHVLLLDEPSNHLDIETIEGLARSLATFDGGVLMVSHDQRLIELVCDEIWSLEDNRVTIWDGDMVSYKQHIMKQMP